MKYTMKQNENGNYVLLRYGKPAINQVPNNAELEFWLRIEELEEEVASVLTLLDGLAEQWGDEGVFRTCRDRLRKLLTTKEPTQ